MSVELWKTIFDWGTVILLGLTFVFGAGALITGDMLGERQEAQSRRFDKDLTDAKEALSKQQERTAIADAKVAGLEHGVADAQAEMARQQARAATAERSLLELQERIKPRHLTDKQSADFVAALTGLPNTPLKLGWTQGGGDESFKLLQQLMPLFRQAHWKVPELTTGVSSHFDIQITGVALLIPGPEGADVRKPEPETIILLNPTQLALQTAFKAVGMDLQFQRWFHTTDGVPELVVGSKPQ